MRNSTRTRQLYFLVALAALALAGCFFDTVTGPIVTVNQNQGQGNGASPSPGGTPTPGGAIASVRVSTFGSETCESASPNPGANVIALGCSSPLTCTPVLASGEPAPEGVHPASPESFDVVSGSAVSLRLQGNPYNRDAAGVALGVSKIRCTVAGVSGEIELEVVAAQ